VTGLILGLVLMPLSIECAAQAPTMRVIDLERKDNGEKRPVVSCVVIESGAGLMASVGDDHLVRVAKIRDGALLYRLEGHSDWVRAAAFQPGGKTLATGGDDRRVILWDMATGTQREVLPQASAVSSVSYSADGQQLACAGFDGRVRVYQGTQLRWDLEGPGPALQAVVFSPDRKTLAAAGRAGRIRIWDVATGQAIRDLDGGRWVRALAYTGDGSALASGGAGRTIRLWDSQSGQLVKESPVRPAEIRSLAFCGPALLASGRTDCRIQVWDVATFQERAQFDKHTGTVSTLAWDGSSGMLVSGSYDTTIRMFFLGAGTSDATTQRPPMSPGLR
jgi:WD40 repeat protein